MNPKDYIVEVQDWQDGYWRQVRTVPVEYVTEEVVHRILWVFKIRRTVVKNRDEAIRKARRNARAYADAEGRGKSVRIMESWWYDDGVGGYRYEVWRGGEWKDENSRIPRKNG